MGQLHGEKGGWRGGEVLLDLASSAYTWLTEDPSLFALAWKLGSGLALLPLKNKGKETDGFLGGKRDTSPNIWLLLKT